MSVSRDDEIFSTEFRHETVVHFVRCYVNGSIRVNIEKLRELKLNNELKDFFTKRWTSLTNDVQEYGSGVHKGEQLNELELRIFREYIHFKALDLLVDGVSVPQVEQEISDIKAKIDSTNSLLAEVLKILKTVLESLEGK